MSHRHQTLLDNAGIAHTPHRMRVLEILENSPSPLSAQEIYITMKRSEDINRVTLYRILDLLVEHKLVKRITAGDRSFRYCLHLRFTNPPHPHFYCQHCGSMECLNGDGMELDMESIQKSLPALIEGVEIRLDGICKNCLRRRENS